MKQGLGRNLKPGDRAVTDYNGKGLTSVWILAEDRNRFNGNSQSGILFQVSPGLKYGAPETWYCADWFEPDLSPLTPDNAPLGTRAPASSGGHWSRVPRGWKWCTGATFPRPGGDWTGELLPPEETR